MKREREQSADAASHEPKVHGTSSADMERLAALRAQVETLARSRTDALHDADLRGCNGAISTAVGSSSAAAGPAGNDQQRLPMLISSTEMGAYIKWALLLQEQLCKACERNRRLTEAIDRLSEENRQLQLAVETGEPRNRGLPPTLLQPDYQRGIPLTSSQASDNRSSSSSLNVLTMTGSSGSSDAGSSGVSATQTQIHEEEEMMNSLLRSPGIGSLSTPNLASLTADLERREASGKGSPIAWAAAPDAAAGWMARAPA